MKINVIKDKHGKAIATFPNVLPNGLKATPILEDGQTVEEREVAEDYHANLSVIYS